MTKKLPVQRPATDAVCIFPRLTKTEVDGVAYHQTDPVEVAIGSVEKVLKSEDIALSSFVLVAWAVTLRCFTECQTAQSWVGSGIEDSNMSGLRDILSIPIEPESSLKSLCQSKK